MDTILEKDQYILIYRTSYFTLLSFLYALYNNHVNLSIVPGSVFIGSILYWSKPDYSWRRYLDMTIAKTCLIYQLTIAYNFNTCKTYYYISGIGLAFYPLGIYYYRKGDPWTSTYCHIVFHIIMNIGNIVLYSGNYISN